MKLLIIGIVLANALTWTGLVWLLTKSAEWSVFAFAVAFLGTAMVIGMCKASQID